MAVRDDFTAGEVLAAADLNDTFGSRATVTVGVEAKTANHTFVLSDAGRLVTMDSGSALSVTIPDNTAVAFATGTVVGVAALGSGVVTIAGAAGVTVNSTAGTAPALSDQFAGAQCYKTGTDTWLVIGSLA